MTFTMDSSVWARDQFADCDLGDKRRTKRLIKIGEQVANNPSASFSEQMEGWGDLKATYRLFDEEDVTFEAIASPHWEQTKGQATGRCLVLNDTTELDFGKHHEIDGLADVGNGSGYGFLLHNALLVTAENQEILGVAGQEIHYRKARPKNESATQRLQRDRESKVWGDLIDEVGQPAAGVQLVHVCDRGADGFEVFCHLVKQHADWVVRASCLHRVIVTPDAERMPLSKYLSTLPLAGTYELKLRARKDQAARTAKLEVRFGTLWMPAPAQQSPYVKASGNSAIAMQVVEVREVDAPPGVEPIAWVLYTSLPVTTFDEAWVVIEYYEARWLVMLKAVRKNLRRVYDLTIRDFYREVAKLGGFLGRKSDGEPGWITIWRGWEKLNMLVRGAELALRFESELKKCG